MFTAHPVKDSILKSNCMQTILFAKAHTVFTRVLPPPVYYPHPNFEGHFQKKKISNIFKNPRFIIHAFFDCALCYLNILMGFYVSSFTFGIQCFKFVYFVLLNILMEVS
jgi:hypothetical protein